MTDSTTVEEPVDVPEGAALVLMSATLFKQLLPEGVSIVTWGSPMSGTVTWYEPTLHSDDADVWRAVAEPDAERVTL